MPIPQGDDEPDDRELLTRICAGDRDAVALVYDRHIRPVYWQAFRTVSDADEAEEVAQEVFLTMWRRAEDIVIVDDSVLPWLLRTAANTALNARRKAARRADRTAPLDDDHQLHAVGSVEDEVLARQVQLAIDTAVAALTPIDRQLYELCVVGDHTYDAAAQRLGVTHAAVRNRVSRLRTRLRNDLRPTRELS